MLTSAGITNKSLEMALRKLVKGEIKIVFIPTSANIEESEKSWLIKDLVNCQKLGSVDIVDISAMDKELWLPRLKKANVIFMGGGNTMYLMKWIRKSGLIDELPNLLKSRVYVGISAGSIVLNPKLIAGSQYLFSKKQPETGLGFVDFYFRPHLNSPHFPKIRGGILRKLLTRFDSELYAVDDESGVVVIDGKIEVVSEGKWIKYSV